MLSILRVFGDSLLCVLKSLGVRFWPKALVPHYEMNVPFYTALVESHSHQVRVQELIAEYPFQLAVVDDLERTIVAVLEIR